MADSKGTLLKNGKVKFEGKWYQVGRKMIGETVEVEITLIGVELWHKGTFIKRWKYWGYVLVLLQVIC